MLHPAAEIPRVTGGKAVTLYTPCSMPCFQNGSNRTLILSGHSPLLTAFQILIVPVILKTASSFLQLLRTHPGLYCFESLFETYFTNEISQY